MNRWWFVLAILLLTVSAVWSKGTQEKDFQDAGRGNFSQTVDLTKLTPGQYNVLVRAKDAAGNVSYAGPFNFQYDPSSDNPIVTIANPSPLTRVGGSMNFVGVSSAPKGTAKVEVKIDEGDWTVAQGKAFWSFPFDAKPLKDGLHKVSVKGTDVNGVVGPVSTVAFYLDQYPPALDLTSIKSGDRVQGEIPFAGTLSDGNGLRLLEYSLDGQKTFVHIDLQGDGNAVSRPFRTMLDTKKSKDGPLVVWFHGVDGQGSEVRRAVLLFVDNALPVITVLSPKPDQGVHGKTRFIIWAEKLMGLKSLTARVGDKAAPVDIPVVAGDPFRAVDLDLPEHGTGTVPVSFEAVDTAGKTGRLVFNAKLNGDADLPEITLALPADKTQVTAPVRLVGSLKATDGPAGVAWSVNGGTESVEPVGAAFDFEIKGLVSGPNKLTLTGVDKNGKRGKPVMVTLTASMGGPTLEWSTASWSGQDVPFRPGLLIGPDRKARLQGKVTWPNPMKSLMWALRDGTPIVATVSQPDKSGQAAFTLALPDDPPFGPVPVTVTATDSYGQTATLKSFVDITNLSKPQDGLAFADARVGQPVIAITPETPLKAVFSGAGIKSAELVGQGNLAAFSVSHDGVITIQAVKDGTVTDAKLRVTDDRGRVWDADLGTLAADTAPPSLTLTSPAAGQWVGGTVKLEGKATDANGIAKLEWSSDGQNWQTVDPPGADGAFSRSISLPDPDDAYRLYVRATDGSGRTAWAQTAVRRFTQAPGVDLVFPEAVAGAYAAGRLRGEGIKEAEVTFDGMSVPLPLDRAFVVPIEAPQTLKFRFTDWAGNVTETSSDAAQTPADASKPVIQILYPPPGATVSGVVPVTGRVAGFSDAPTVTIKGGAGDIPVDLTAAGYFSVDIDSNALKNRSFTVMAVGGKQNASAGFNLPAETPPLPKARFSSAKFPLGAPAAVSGWLGGRGAVGYSWQLDGGAKTAVNASGGPLGAFLVDLSTATPGPHKVTVIPTDPSGAGAPITTDVIVPAAAGHAEFSSELGAPLTVGKDSRLSGKLSGASWSKAEYRFADLSLPDGWNGPFQALNVQKDGGFDIPVPTLPYGRIGVVVRAEDIYGQRVETRTYFEHVWSKTSTVEDKDGLYFVDQRLNDQGRFETEPGTPLAGTFRGRPLKSLTITPATAGVTAQNDNGVISLTAANQGVYGPFKVTAVTVDNETFGAGPFTIVAGSGGPEIDWKTPQNADWIRDSVALQGTVTAATGVTALEASFDGDTWTPVALKKDGTFDAKIPATGADGLTRVLLRATDKGGLTTMVSRAITKDNTAPEFTIVAPPPDRKINGLTTIAGTATDLNPITSIEYSEDGKKFLPADGTDVFAFDLNLQSYVKLPEHFYVRTTDAAGNQAVTPIDLPIDQDADKPVVQIQTPADGEVIRSDFEVSGLSYDDDGVKSVSWRIDNGPWTELVTESSFQIPIPISGLTDNEHTVEVQATDIYGTKGDIAKSTFKVSLAAPSAVLLSPQVETTSNGLVTLAGASFDRNGIDHVDISLDNGLTWNRAVLHPTELTLPKSGLPEVQQFTPKERKEWEWRFDSHTLKDGTYLVMVKSTDSYDTEGLLTTLVSIDNTPPELTLSSPPDGERLLDSVDLDGRSSDNIALVSLKAELRSESVPAPTGPLPKGTPPPLGPVLLQTDLPITPTFHEKWNLGSLAPGWYNIRLEAKDKAGNTTFAACNVRIEGATADRVDLFYPQSGETLNSTFFVEGKVTSRTPAGKVTVTFDGKTKIEANADEQGYFSVAVDETALTAGDHTVAAAVAAVASEPRSFSYNILGPWLKVASHSTGSYVTQRPFLTGTAGWKDEILPAGANQKDTEAYHKQLEQHQVASVEVSIDNGKTFTPAQGTTAWKYRIESLGLPDGPLPLLVRAHYRNGTMAYRKLLVTVLQTPPVVKLLTPVENGRFNLALPLSGYSEGEAEAAIAVRQGDKGGYEVPSFIQGAYLDVHIWGATYYEVGAGLTFFQDAVKLQAQYGEAPPGRFFGSVVGSKLIANIAQFPLGYWLGPDWSWLSTSLGIGANFESFSMGGGVFSSQSVFLGGVVAQWEVAKATLRDLKMFKSYAWYLETTAWFISSDVQAETKFTYSTGIRIGLL
jgi:hypothetical protein